MSLEGRSIASFLATNSANITVCSLLRYYGTIIGNSTMQSTVTVWYSKIQYKIVQYSAHIQLHKVYKLQLMLPIYRPVGLLEGVDLLFQCTSKGSE